MPQTAPMLQSGSLREGASRSPRPPMSEGMRVQFNSLGLNMVLCKSRVNGLVFPALVVLEGVCAVGRVCAFPASTGAQDKRMLPRKSG